MRLITQRSQVQILSPLQVRQQVRGPFSLRGGRASGVVVNGWSACQAGTETWHAIDATSGFRMGWRMTQHRLTSHHSEEPAAHQGGRRAGSGFIPLVQKRSARHNRRGIASRQVRTGRRGASRPRGWTSRTILVLVGKAIGPSGDGWGDMWIPRSDKSHR